MPSRTLPTTMSFRRRDPLVGDDRARRQIPEEIQDEGALADVRRGERDSTRLETLGRIRSFDPFGFARSTARAQFADLDEEFDEREAGRMVFNNRRGLFGSPIGAGEQRRDFNDRLARALARNSFEAARLEGENIDRLGGVAQADRNEAFDTRTRELDLVSSQADREQGAENFRREMADREAARRAKKKKKGGFLGFLGDAIGLVPGVGQAIDTVTDIIDRF